MRFCIHVVDDDDNPCYDERVTVELKSEWKTERTDDDGNAFFESDEEESCSFNLFIGNYKYGEQTAEDEDSLTFTLNEGVGTFKFTVHVVDEDDDPVNYARVTCDFGLWTGVSVEHTDDDGNAEFKLHTSKEHVRPQVYVEDNDMGEQEMSARMVTHSHSP